MITRPKKQRCASCNCWFAPADLRPVVIDGISKVFCWKCPTPAEINARRLVVQAGWSASIEHSRRGCNYEPWRVPVMAEQ